MTGNGFHGLPMIPMPVREHARAGRFQEDSMSTPETSEVETVERCYRPNCGAAIHRLRNTSTGRNGPIDAAPVANGNIIVNLAAGTYTVLGPAKAAATDQPLHLNHWMTCLNPPDRGTKR